MPPVPGPCAVGVRRAQEHRVADDDGPDAHASFLQTCSLISDQGRGLGVSVAGTPRSRRLICLASSAPRRSAVRVRYETDNTPITATGSRDKAPSPARKWATVAAIHVKVRPAYAHSFNVGRRGRTNTMAAASFAIPSRTRNCCGYATCSNLSIATGALVR